MATDANPIYLPADGTWIAVGGPGYGSRFFMIAGGTGVQFAHAMSQPAPNDDIGIFWDPGKADNIGTDDTAVTLWAKSATPREEAKLRVVG